MVPIVWVVEKCGKLEYENSTMSATPQLIHNTQGTVAVNITFPRHLLVTRGLLHTGGQLHPFGGTGPSEWTLMSSLLCWCDSDMAVLNGDLLSSHLEAQSPLKCAPDAPPLLAASAAVIPLPHLPVHPECSVFYPEQACRPGESLHNLHVRRLSWFLCYYLICRPTSTLATCPNCVKMSFSVLVQFYFVPATSHHFHKQMTLIWVADSARHLLRRMCSRFIHFMTGISALHLFFFH